MPLGDQTGPRGKGAVTGRGAGISYDGPIKPRDDRSLGGGGRGGGYGPLSTRKYYDGRPNYDGSRPRTNQRMASFEEAGIRGINWADIYHYR